MKSPGLLLVLFLLIFFTLSSQQESQDLKESRVDLFPAMRTFVRVMRMVNRRDAFERMKEGMAKIVAKRGQFSMDSRLRRVRLLKRLLSIVGSKEHKGIISQ